MKELAAFQSRHFPDSMTHDTSLSAEVQRLYNPETHLLGPQYTVAPEPASKIKVSTTGPQVDTLGNTQSQSSKAPLTHALPPKPVVSATSAYRRTQGHSTTLAQTLCQLQGNRQIEIPAGSGPTFLLGKKGSLTRHAT